MSIRGAPFTAAILRGPDAQSRRKAFADFVKDLKVIAQVTAD